MSATDVQTIATAVMTKLKAEIAEVYYVEETDPQVTSFEEFLLMVQLPSIAIGYFGSDFQTGDESGELRLQRATITVIVITDDYRGYITAMNEPTGINLILKKCADSLFGETLGLELYKGLELESERPLSAVPGRVAWQQTWIVEFYR